MTASGRHGIQEQTEEEESLETGAELRLSNVFFKKEEFMTFQVELKDRRTKCWGRAASPTNAS